MAPHCTAFPGKLIFCYLYGFLKAWITYSQIAAFYAESEKILRPKQGGLHFSDDSFKCILWNENIWISEAIMTLFNDVEIKAWMSNYIPHSTSGVIAFQCSNLTETMLIKQAYWVL